MSCCIGRQSGPPASRSARRLHPSSSLNSISISSNSSNISSGSSSHAWAVMQLCTGSHAAMHAVMQLCKLRLINRACACAGTTLTRTLAPSPSRGSRVPPRMHATMLSTATSLQGTATEWPSSGETTCLRGRPYSHAASNAAVHAHAAGLPCREGNDVSESSTVTYQQLLDMVCQIANYMKSVGVGKGDDVTIYMPMVTELPATMVCVCVCVCARVTARRSEWSPLRPPPTLPRTAGVCPHRRRAQCCVCRVQCRVPGQPHPGLAAKADCDGLGLQARAQGAMGTDVKASCLCRQLLSSQPLPAPLVPSRLSFPLQPIHLKVIVDEALVMCERDGHPVNVSALGLSAAWS
jgi:hypothetical protein